MLLLCISEVELPVIPQLATEKGGIKEQPVPYFLDLYHQLCNGLPKEQESKERFCICLKGDLKREVKTSIFEHLERHEDQ